MQGNSSPLTKQTNNSSGRKSLKNKKGGSPGKSPTKGGIAIGGLCGILASMMDKICPTNLAASEGLGTDNMTGILVEFIKAEED